MGTHKFRPPEHLAECAQTLQFAGEHFVVDALWLGILVILIEVNLEFVELVQYLCNRFFFCFWPRCSPPSKK